MTEDNNRQVPMDTDPSGESSEQETSPTRNLEEEVWGAPPLDEKVPAGESAGASGTEEGAGLSQEEADALVKGLEGLDFLSDSIPEIPDLEEEPDKGDESSQSSVDDIIASVQGAHFDMSGSGDASSGPAAETRPVSFPSLEPGDAGHDGAGDNRTLSLLMDIPVQLSVVLGRTQKTIGEILALEAGSIVELDKLAGEPVDVLANGKLILKGEVVVIDESFGVRVTELISNP